jgi:hypothetical protein
LYSDFSQFHIKNKEKMMFPNRSVPSLYVQSQGEDISVKVALSVTQARDKVVVRLTGGCGLMSGEHAQEIERLLAEPFRGFRGGMLFGGTRMVSRKNASQIIPGITEIAPLVREMCPEARVLGVVARANDFQIMPEFGLVIENNSDNDYVTITHPNQDVCLVLQKSVDHATVWDAEYQACEQIVRHLREYAAWQSVLLTYNGGGITEKEILLWAKNGWPVILVNGSGRKTEEYANDKAFLNDHPHVVVAEPEVWSIRERLEQFGAIPEISRKTVLRVVG